MSDFMSKFSLPENLRIKVSLARLEDWFETMSDEDYAVLRATALTFLPPPEAYPDAKSEKERLVRWFQCSEHQGWDPNWPQIISRIMALSDMLDKDLGARPVSLGDALQERLPDDLPTEAHHPENWHKLREEWASLRATDLSAAYLRAGMTDVSLPLDAVSMPVSPKAGASSVVGATVTGDPLASLLSWVEALDGESLMRVFKPINDLIPLALLPQQAKAAQLSHLRDWLAAGDVSEPSLHGRVMLNRFTFIVTAIENGLRGRFDGSEFDRMVKIGEQIEAGDIPDWIAATREMDETMYEGLKQMVLDNAKTAPELRIACEKAGQTWDALAAGDFETERLRVWCKAS